MKQRRCALSACCLVVDIVTITVVWHCCDLWFCLCVFADIQRNLRSSEFLSCFISHLLFLIKRKKHKTLFCWWSFITSTKLIILIARIMMVMLSMILRKIYLCILQHQSCTVSMTTSVWASSTTSNVKSTPWSSYKLYWLSVYVFVPVVVLLSLSVSMSVC